MHRFFLRCLIIVAATLTASGVTPAQSQASNDACGVPASPPRDPEEVLAKCAAQAQHLSQTAGPQSRAYAVALNDLGELYRNYGLNRKAIDVLVAAVTIYEGIAPQSLGMATSLNNLGLAKVEAGSYQDAEAFFERSASITRGSSDFRSPAERAYRLGTTLNNLGYLQLRRGANDKAVETFKDALSVFEAERLTSSANYANTLNDLGQAYEARSDFAQAIAAYQRAVAIADEVPDFNAKSKATFIHNLAVLRLRENQLDAGAADLARAITIATSALGEADPLVTTMHETAAYVQMQRQNWKQALEELDKAYAAHKSRVLVRSELPQSSRDAAQEIYDGFAVTYAKAAYESAHSSPDGSDEVIAKSFEVAKWALQSSAADALALTAARFALSDTGYGRLLQKRTEVLLALRDEREHWLTLLSAESAGRDAHAIAASETRVSELDAKRQVINGELQTQYPRISEEVAPPEVTLKDVQSVLAPDEALFQFILGSAEGYGWLVTSGVTAMVRINARAVDVIGELFILRCSVDVGQWQADTQDDFCTHYVGPRGDSRYPPFQLEQAGVLYVQLFKALEPVIAGKTLLIAAPSYFNQVPMHLLVTEPPKKKLAVKPEDFSGTAWFARRNAIAVLPSVSSLVYLRKLARPSQASNSYVGFGNPVLMGPAQGLPSKLDTAWEAIKDLFRGGVADAESVRRLRPLPDTAQEIKDVAGTVGAKEGDVFLGADATERKLKELSRSGKLRSYRVLHLATHGLLAGDLKSLEPALVMTPPAKGSAEDDGVLTESEISGLDLDADWVVLSACNTASASEAQGVEALSGLARAFFSAGARSLLVSGWRVNSATAVQLTTETFRNLRTGAPGRAKALQQAMLKVIDEAGNSLQAHPAVWAPFYVVGEAGR